MRLITALLLTLALLCQASPALAMGKRDPQLPPNPVRQAQIARWLNCHAPHGAPERKQYALWQYILTGDAGILARNGFRRVGGEYVYLDITCKEVR